MSTRKIIRQVAKNNGVSPKEVERDIKAAIRAAMASENPETQAFWREISPNGKEPSVDRFLKFCAKRCKDTIDN